MKTLRILCAFLMCSLFLCGCTTNKDPISKTAIYFDTVISIKLYDSQDTEILDQCFAFCEDFEQTISRTIETSEISQINNSKGKKVHIIQICTLIFLLNSYFVYLS